MPLDLDGNPRVVDATVDLGAYEDQTAPGVTVSVTDIAVAEGGDTNSYTIRLNSQPTTDVTFAITTSGQIKVDPITLTFTTSTWSTEQTVIVNAVDDVLIEGTHSDTISHELNSNDAAYHELAASSVSVTIEDNDTAGITTAPVEVSVAEGGATGTYSVVLTSVPTADIMLTAIGDPQCTVSGALTFASTYWNIPQDIIVTAVEDALVEGSHTCMILHTIESDDPDYDQFTASSVSVPSKTMTQGES